MQENVNGNQTENDFGNVRSTWLRQADFNVDQFGFRTC